MGGESCLGRASQTRAATPADGETDGGTDGRPQGRGRPPGRPAARTAPAVAPPGVAARSRQACPSTTREASRGYGGVPHGRDVGPCRRALEFAGESQPLVEPLLPSSAKTSSDEVHGCNLGAQLKMSATKPAGSRRAPSQISRRGPRGWWVTAQRTKPAGQPPVSWVEPVELPCPHEHRTSPITWWFS